MGGRVWVHVFAGMLHYSLVPFLVTFWFMFINLGLQHCGIYYSCLKSTNLEASELKKIFNGVQAKVRLVHGAKRTI